MNWLLGSLTAFVAGLTFLGFGATAYQLFTDHSGMNRHMHRVYNMSAGQYLAIHIVISLSSLIICVGTLYALQKNRGNLVLLFAAMLFLLFAALFGYGMYCMG